MTPKRRSRRHAIDAAPVTAADLRALQRELDRRFAGGRVTGSPPKKNKPRSSKKGSKKSKAKMPKATAAAPLRWNPEPEDVQRSVAQLVLTIVEFLRKLMERQAIRRMEQQTLTAAEVEAVGAALMTLEQTIREIGARFGVSPEDLNLDLGPIKLMPDA